MISAVDNNMSGACLGQHLGHIVNNGQQSAVLFFIGPSCPLWTGGPFTVLIQYGLNFVYTKKEDKVRFGLFQLQDI